MNKHITIHYQLGDATCDGCSVYLVGEKETVLNLRIKFSEMTFNVRYIRPRGHNHVIIE